MTLSIAVLAAAGWRVALGLASTRGRQRAAAAVARVWRWEFWPMWLFYLPVAVWTAWLAIRHRGYRTITAANPGMPDGGVVGESKFAILSTCQRNGSSRPRSSTRDGSNPDPRARRLPAGSRLGLSIGVEAGRRAAGTGVRLAAPPPSRSTTSRECRVVCSSSRTIPVRSRQASSTTGCPANAPAASSRSRISTFPWSSATVFATIMR